MAYYVDERGRNFLASFKCAGMNFVIEKNAYLVKTYTQEAKWLLAEFIKEQRGV